MGILLLFSRLLNILLLLIMLVLMGAFVPWSYSFVSGVSTIFSYRLTLSFSALCYVEHLSFIFRLSLGLLRPSSYTFWMDCLLHCWCIRRHFVFDLQFRMCV